jgi:murein DD-endopeptidase MepM/ murein hydrolase activator NlpD
VIVKNLLKILFGMAAFIVIPSQSGKSRTFYLPLVGFFVLIFLWLLSTGFAAVSLIHRLSYQERFTKQPIETTAQSEVAKKNMAQENPAIDFKKPKQLEQSVADLSEPIDREVTASIDAEALQIEESRKLEETLADLNKQIESFFKKKKELSEFIGYDMEDDFSFIDEDLSEPSFDDIDALREEAAKAQEYLSAIKEYLSKERDSFFAQPQGWPVKGKITSSFGRRINPVTRQCQFHTAVDIGKIGAGVPVKATADGIVSFSGWSSGSGNVVIISHGFGFETVYAHNKTNQVKVGQIVNRGDTIALVGSTGRSTGPHVHYSILKDGKPVNPIPYINGEKNYVQKER